MTTQNDPRIEKLEWEQKRVRDAVFDYARENKLNSFLSEWEQKDTAASDHNLPNLVFAFLDALDEDNAPEHLFEN